MSMHLSWGLYINSVLLCPNVLAYASFLSRGDKQLSTDKSLNRTAFLPQHPSLQGSNKRRHGSLMSAEVMTKRDDDQNDDLRVREIKILTISVPVTVAANALEHFYNVVLFNALNPWGSQPPQQLVSLTMGPLHLTMTVAIDDGVPQGIPWDFVRNFARNMLAVTAMGFTGTYDMYYVRDGGFLSFLRALVWKFAFVSCWVLD